MSLPTNKNCPSCYLIGWLKMRITISVLRSRETWSLVKVDLSWAMPFWIPKMGSGSHDFGKDGFPASHGEWCRQSVNRKKGMKGIPEVWDHIWKSFFVCDSSHTNLQKRRIHKHIQHPEVGPRPVETNKILLVRGPVLPFLIETLENMILRSPAILVPWASEISKFT